MPASPALMPAPSPLFFLAAALPKPGAGQGDERQQLPGPCVQDLRRHWPPARVALCLAARPRLWHLHTPEQGQPVSLPRPRYEATGTATASSNRPQSTQRHASQHVAAEDSKEASACSKALAELHTLQWACLSGDLAGTYTQEGGIGPMVESKHSSLPRPVFGTATRDGQAKVSNGGFVSSELLYTTMRQP